METKNQTKTVNKVDLMKELNNLNKSASVSKAIKNKYIYPDELKNEKSTDKQKKSYRRKIQKTLLFYLSANEITKESKKEFESFCKLFILNFVSLEKTEVNNLYSFHNAKEKEEAEKILQKYKQLK